MHSFFKIQVQILCFYEIFTSLNMRVPIEEIVQRFLVKLMRSSPILSYLSSKTHLAMLWNSFNDLASCKVQIKVGFYILASRKVHLSTTYLLLSKKICMILKIELGIKAETDMPLKIPTTPYHGAVAPHRQTCPFESHP